MSAYTEEARRLLLKAFDSETPLDEVPALIDRAFTGLTDEEADDLHLWVLREGVQGAVPRYTAEVASAYGPDALTGEEASALTRELAHRLATGVRRIYEGLEND